MASIMSEKIMNKVDDTLCISSNLTYLKPLNPSRVLTCYQKTFNDSYYNLTLTWIHWLFSALGPGFIVLWGVVSAVWKALVFNLFVVLLVINHQSIITAPIGNAVTFPKLFIPNLLIVSLFVCH